MNAVIWNMDIHTSIVEIDYHGETDMTATVGWKYKALPQYTIEVGYGLDGKSFWEVLVVTRRGRRIGLNTFDREMLMNQIVRFFPKLHVMAMYSAITVIAKTEVILR